MCRADPPVLPWEARVESSTLAFPTITTIVICVDLSTQRHESTTATNVNIQSKRSIIQRQRGRPADVQKRAPIPR